MLHGNMFHFGVCVELHTCDIVIYGFCVGIDVTGYVMEFVLKNRCYMLRYGICVDIERCCSTCYVTEFVLT